MRHQSRHAAAKLREECEAVLRANGIEIKDEPAPYFPGHHALAPRFFLHRAALLVGEGRVQVRRGKRLEDVETRDAAPVLAPAIMALTNLALARAHVALGNASDEALCLQFAERMGEEMRLTILAGKGAEKEEADARRRESLRKLTREEEAEIVRRCRAMQKEGRPFKLVDRELGREFEVSPAKVKALRLEAGIVRNRRGRGKS